MRLRCVCMLALGVLLAGCATVRTTPYRERTLAAGDALPGLTYRLPMVQYDLTIVRSLAECPGGTTEDGKPTTLKFSTDVSPEKRYVPGEAYTLDPRLTGVLKTSSLEVNYYSNGTLKSVGVAAEDHTGQVVENAAKIAAAGLMLTAGVPPVAVAAAAAGTAGVPATKSLLNLQKSVSTELEIKPVGPSQVVCTDEAKAQLKAFVEADAAIKKETKALTAANDAMTALTEEIGLKLKKPSDQGVPHQWESVLAEQRRATAAIESAKEAKAKALKELSVKDTLRWPEHFGDTRQPRDLPLSAASREKLAKLLEIGKAERVLPRGGFDVSVLSTKLQTLPSDKSVSLFGGSTATAAESGSLIERLTAAAGKSPPEVPPECRGDSTVEACLKHHLDLYLSVGLEWPLAGPCSDTSANDAECVHLRQAAAPTDDPGQDIKKAMKSGLYHARDAVYDEGFFIREPAQGKLLVCRKALLADGQCKPEDDLAETDPANFPQLGQLRFLKFEVPMFQAKDMGVFLTEDGRLERYYMKSTKAALEAATASAANAAATMADAVEKRETERRADLEYEQNAEGKALQAQITELENQDNLKTLQKPPSTDPLKPVRDAAAENQAYIAELQSQLVREQLQKALESQDDAAVRALLEILKSS